MPTFEFDDAHYRALSDLLLAIRDARLAWRAARAGVAEWNTFAAAIRRGQRAAAPLDVMIDEAKSRAAGWWRRANTRNHNRAADAIESSATADMPVRAFEARENAKLHAIPYTK